MSAYSVVRYYRPNSALCVTGKEKTLALAVAEDTEQLSGNALCVGFGFWYDCLGAEAGLVPGSAPLLRVKVSMQDQGLLQERKADVVLHYCALVLPHLPWLGSFMEILVWHRVPIVSGFDVATNEISCCGMSWLERRWQLWGVNISKEKDLEVWGIAVHFA